MATGFELFRNPLGSAAGGQGMRKREAWRNSFTRMSEGGEAGEGHIH